MVWVAQQSFATGEISPSIFGLVTASQYRNGCQTLVNALLTPTGAAKKRYGTEHLLVATLGHPAALFSYYAKGRQYVVQFVSQDDDAGDLNTVNRQVRVIDAVTRAFVNVGDNAIHGPFDAFGDATAFFHHFTATQLPQVYAFQDNERIYFLHPDRPPLFMERQVLTGGTERWKYGVAPPPPTTPRVVDFSVNATISQPLATQLESSVPLFEKRDEGAYWRVGGAEKSNPLTFVLGAWFRTDTYVSPTTMNGAQVYGAIGDTLDDWAGPYLVSAASTFNVQLNVASSAQNDQRVATVQGGSPVLKINEIGTPILIGGQLWMIQNVTSTTQMNVQRLEGTAVQPAATNLASNFLAVGGLPSFLVERSYLKRHPIWATALSGAVNIHSIEPVIGAGLTINDPWLPSGHENTFDRVSGVSVGGTIHMNGGIIALTGLTTNNGPGADEPVYAGRVVRDLAYRSPSMMWSMGMSEGVGFPAAGANHQGRVWFGGFREKPTRVVASRTFSPDDFTPGALDDDGLEFNISDPNGGRVSWMESAPDLLLGTSTGEFAGGGVPITPTNLNFPRQSGYGSKNVRPLLVGGGVLFAGAGGTSVREMAFVNDDDRYNSPDLTELAKHIFESITIEQLAYVSSPDQIVYARDANDKLYAFSYWRANGVAGWSPFVQPVFPKDSGAGTDTSTIESITAVRADGVNITKDELWIIRRLIAGGESTAGTVQRTIERMTPDFAMDMTATDTSPTSTQIGPAVTTLVDLSLAAFLPQAMVQENAGDDYVYIGDFATSGVGLAVVPTLPFTPNAGRLGREIRFNMVPVTQHSDPDQAGDTQGRLEKVTTALLLVRNSKGGTAGDGVKAGNLHPPGVSIPNAATPSAAITALSEWRKVMSVGVFGSMSRLEVIQTEPYHFEVAGINYQMTYGK